MKTCICPRCKGSGKVPLEEPLLTVYKVIKRMAKDRAPTIAELHSELSLKLGSRRITATHNNISALSELGLVTKVKGTEKGDKSFRVYLC